MIDISMTWPLYRRRQVNVGGRVIQLSPLECGILSTLLLNRGKSVSADEIAESVYLGEDGGPDWAASCITVTICRLRQRLGALVIENRFGFGYRIPLPREQVSLAGLTRAETLKPLAHRTAAAGDGMLAATELPPGSHLIRLHPKAGGPYDRMLVVSEQDEGRRLVLSGWIGPPLTRSQWRAAKAALFPAAEVVSWERRRPDGTFHKVAIAV